ncbi:MAG: hypothetical protein NTV43_00125 [Methylococcales bacterium]|nr:hypothetical protein [Methylococcales bacterium]
MNPKEAQEPFIKASPVTDMAYTFAVRRLVRTGTVCRADITNTIGCSAVIASRAMQKVSAFTADVIKKGQNLQFKDPYFASKPNNNHIFMVIASDSQLSDAIKKGGDPKLTGLYPDELPVNIKTWSFGDSVSSGLLTAIAACTLHIKKAGKRIDHRSSLSILYVSMQKGASCKWRNIVPLGLERILDQWRLIAHDLDSEGYPIKTYVLARVFGHRSLTAPLPVNFYRYLKALNDLNELVRIELNPDLTKDQEDAIRNELNIDKDCAMEISQRSKVDFLRRFSDIPTTESAIWPVILNTRAIHKRH